MIKNKVVVLLVAALMLFMTMGMTTQAAVSTNCPICAMSGTVTILRMDGIKEGHYTDAHTVEYTENQIYYKIDCTRSWTVEKLSWYCTNGHGLIYSKRHYIGYHSCDRCGVSEYLEDL